MSNEVREIKLWTYLPRLRPAWTVSTQYMIGTQSPASRYYIILGLSLQGLLNFLELGIIDPELAELLKDVQLPKVEEPEQSNSGAIFVRQQNMMLEEEKARYETSPTHGVEESIRTIPMRDGYESEIRVFQPPTPPATGSPLVVLNFGGGFIAGSNYQLVPYARAFAVLYGATAVTLSYRLAPQHKFPTAPNDVWDSIKWLAAHASELGADPTAGFVIGGISSGGNLSIVTAHQAAKENLSPPLTGVWACIPLVTSDKTVPEKYKELYLSRKQNAVGSGLSKKGMEKIQQALQADVLSELYTPFAVPETFSKMPPTWVQVEGRDPLRDDGLIYVQVLRDHGVSTRLDVYPGVPHAHFTTFPKLKSAKKFQVDVTLGMGWLLKQELDEEKLKKIVRV